jgi:hypothetical protein
MARSFREYYNTLSETDKNEIEKRVMVHLLNNNLEKGILSISCDVMPKANKRPIPDWDKLNK